MEITEEMQKFLFEEANKRFLKYIKIDTTSDEKTGTFPSTEKQFELGKLLVEELKELGFQNVVIDEFCFVYADLPATKGNEKAPGISLLAHMDTSPAVSGENIEPIIHKNYDGKPIKYPKNPDIELTMKDSPILKEYIGMDIITSSGDTLLGSDDKAGIAGIMAAGAAWQKYPELVHGPITVCFTPDEEIGHGTTKINMDRLPDFGYTLDGGEMGELEIECFDAWRATVTFKGVSVHPGYSKNLMINAAEIASRYVAQIPEYETPQHTENREGFYHLTNLSGDCVNAKAVFILRDFKKELNEKRIDYLNSLKATFEKKYPGVKIEVKADHSYENMYVYLEEHPEIINKAAEAIKQAGMKLQQHLIRGGTDGARLSARGKPTPNLFAGGLLFHSLKEHIPTLALQKAAETILHLANNWTK
ncbi:MAG: peptidase T [Candidatus Heimdallarchaeota archaeon]